MHWLDEDSVEFVQRLVRNIEAYPIALLATARPESDKRFFGPNVDYQTLDLTTLPPEVMVQLATELLGAPPDPQLAALLNERAGGNPFFAEQILLFLRDEGLLEQVDGMWHVETRDATSLLPSNVRAIFIARLDRLSHDVREAVQSAAVLGREFEVQVLMSMLEMADSRGLRWTSDIWSCVHDAERAAIWAQLGELRYLFKHVLLRDAAYEMQVQTRRAHLHQLAAEALETLYDEDIDTHLGELAYHYEAACLLGAEGTAAKARTYVTRAAKEAADRYENTAAIDYYTRALALTPEDDWRCPFRSAAGACEGV